MKTILLNHGAL